MVEAMSTHDRGAFGQLLAEAKELGETRLSFHVDLMADPEAVYRWDAAGERYSAHGRTGEEALRKLVESLREQRARA